jgi:tagatose-1,6-bisphosphate aldolase non-catalytic subunit AgaZ/GatZ
MFLDEVIQAQKRGEAKVITSICLSHLWGLKTVPGDNRLGRLQTAESAPSPVLIESACNQVNQFGGFSMKLSDDPEVVLGVEVSSRLAAQLAKVAE